MSKLFTPVKIGNLVLNNRFTMAPMENGYAEFGGEVSDKLIEFFLRRTTNDVPLIITGSIGISPEGRGLPTQLSLYDDKYIPGLKKMTDAIHKVGGYIGAQLYHAGRQATDIVTGITPIAPSAIPCAILSNNPREMNKEDFDIINTKFIEASKRSVEAGFDLIEVHFAHGYLLHSFLSPHSNKRTDQYGGSLENRMRYPMQVLKNIIDSVEGKIPVTIRVSVDEYLEDGLKFEEVKTICVEAEKIGIAAISLTAGSYDSVEYAIQPMFIQQGFIIPYAQELKKIVKVPIIVAARLNSATLIEDIIENNKADMVAIGRGLIADQELVVKMKKQAYDDIRYCIACNQGCIDNVFVGKGAACLVNASAKVDDKDRVVKKAQNIKNIVIIGAGPGGLEASRVAALKGHRVTLIDKSSKMGGKLDTVAIPPEKDTFLLFKDYLLTQFKKLNINFIQRDIKSAQDIKEYNPNTIIIATGAVQTLPQIKGIDFNNVMLAEDVLNGTKETGNTVAVIGGGLVGVETAKFLASKGKKVHIIEMLDRIASDIGATYIGHVLKFLSDHSVNQHVNSEVIEIRKDSVITKNEEIKADSVVIATGYKENNLLADDIKNNFNQVYIIGDAACPRRIIDAVEEGFLTANEI